MIGCTFVTQSLVRHKERAFGKLFKRTARACGDDLAHTGANQPIKYLRSRCSSYGGLAKHYFFALVFCYVDRVKLRCADELRHLSRFRLACVFVNILTKESENALLRELQIYFFVCGVDDRRFLGIKLQYRYFVFNNTHLTFLQSSSSSP